MFFEQTRIFQEGLSNRHVFSRRFYLFVEPLSTSLVEPRVWSNRPYYLIKQILIFQKPLFSHRTDIHFPGSLYFLIEHILFSRRPLCLEQIGKFQEDTPSLPWNKLEKETWLRNESLQVKFLIL